ncbi:Ring assembly protein 3 [Fulvia fulva]|uniref:Ring assembly protein 3 n=1 Tax=Passalora fulva TaxID=5499 RepID=A0A9Q8UT05_PASFU|nr:Ring assembly protein 3 [Fulvia fulva]KAK4619238.1 Ring assembly protein 3 [Fulvia fulva]UJO21356.1 Ring assembly protein 3 [Fulvia fulva]WPV32913.1 Ring assembly protein 3 [Fulvia fulva]
MSSSDVQDRVDQLLTKAEKSARDGGLQQAFQALKEASHLDAENAKVKNALLALQKQEDTGDASHLVRSYLGSGPDLDGEKAVSALRQKQLPEDEANFLLDLLLQTTAKRDLLDSLTGALLLKNVAARKKIAGDFRNIGLNTLFDQFYERGEESFKAFSNIPLDEAPWADKDVQKAAQVDLFRLCVAKIIDTDVDYPDRLMQAIARQLAVAPDNLSSAVDGDVLEVIMDCLDIRLESQLRGQAMLATSKILETLKDTGETLFAQYLADKVARQTNDELIVAFSAASAVFPMIPSIAAKLFMTDGFVQQLVPNLERNSEAASQGQRKSKTLEQAALELLSAACVDKSCREAIDRYCSPWLHDLSEERNGTHQALAALVLAKVNAESQDSITEKLADLVLVGGDGDQAVEGLAYTSLQPKIKEDIASNQQLLKRLVDALNERPSAAFGCLTIFTNLTAYRPVQTTEQKKMAQLKAYAASQKPTPDNPLDNDSYVTGRAKKLLDADVVPALVACCKQTSSPTNIAMVVRILLALSKEQKYRAKMAQQGAARLLLQIRERVAKTDKSTAEASTIERNASHALARLLISVNPAHVFSATLSVSTAVSALIPLLSYDTESEQRDLLPTFESLLALTNLASMEDNAARNVQIRNAWDKLEDLLFSSNTLVQRASVELVCNLMASPSGVAKFADGSKEAKRRMQILLALGDVEDLATRRAAGGALAMLTEWDSAVTAVLEKERGVSVVIGMCEDDSDEMRHRGFAILLNVLNAPKDVGERRLKAVKDADGVEVLKEALRKSKSQEVLGLGVEVLKKLQ